MFSFSLPMSHILSETVKILLSMYIKKHYHAKKKMRVDDCGVFLQ